MTKTQAKLKLVDQRIDLMVEYLRMRLELGDWHGVMDAAADLRELEAERRVLQEREAP